MHIDITIPFRPGKQLGEYMNDYMEHAEDWVLFIDHDILLLNPFWYYICEDAIKQVGHQAGFITCKTNRIGCHWQRQEGIEMSNNDIEYHIKKSKEIYNLNKGKIFEPDNHGAFSGFFILTHKQAWKDAGKFNSGWKVDNWYDEAIRKIGYKRYVMQDLYCYHLYTLKRKFYE